MRGISTNIWREHRQRANKSREIMDYTTAYYLNEDTEIDKKYGFVLIHLTFLGIPICLAGWGRAERMKRLSDMLYSSDLKRIVSDPDRWFGKIGSECRNQSEKEYDGGLLLAAVGSEFLAVLKEGQLFALNNFYGSGHAEALHSESGMLRGRLECGVGLLLLDTERQEIIQSSGREAVKRDTEYGKLIGECMFFEKELTEARAEKHLKELACYSRRKVRRAAFLYADSKEQAVYEG